MPRPLNLDILMPEDVNWDLQFHEVLFHYGTSTEVAACRALAYVREYMDGWEEHDSVKYMNAAIIEVDDVIRVLQEWKHTVQQVIVLPEAIAKSKQQFSEIGETDVSAGEAHWKKLKALMAQLKMDPTILAALKKEVYLEESSMAQMIRSVQED